MSDDVGTLDWIDQVPLPIIRLDDAGGFVDCNEAAAAVFGGTRAALRMNASAAPRVSLESLRVLGSLLERALRGEATGSIEVVWRRSDGEHIRTRTWLAPTGRAGVAPAGLLAFSVRMVAGERLEEDLQDLRERLARLSEHNLAAVWRVSLDGRIVECNAEFVRIFGYRSVEEALSVDARKMYFDDADLELITTSFRDGDVRVPHEVCMRKRNAEPIWVLQREQIVRERSGEEFLEVIAVDVTHQRDVEQQLVLSERFASIGQLAGSIAHEINNPLSFIATNLDFTTSALQNVPGVSPDVFEAIDDARLGTKRIVTIARELRNFAEAQRHERVSRVDIHRVIDDALGLVANEIRHRARLVRSLDPVPLVEANPGQLGQLVLGILVEAVHSMSEERASKNVLKVSTRPGEERSVIVEVEDTGSTDDVFPAVPSKRANAADRRGIGLVLSRDIARRMGGFVAVEATLDSGTRYTITLPGARETSTRPGPNDGGASVPPLRGTRVLVVDDEIAIQRVVTRILDDAVVVGASDGRSAVDLVRAERPFDLVLCDVMLPGMSGADTYHALIAANARLRGRVIFMTGGAFTTTTQHFIDSSGVPCIAKPFTADDLRGLLSRVLSAAASPPSR